METKKEIRKRILEIRNTLSNSERNEKSNIIYDKLIGHPLYKDAKEIYCYVSTSEEVNTTRLIKHALEGGKKVAVPKISGASMDFYYIQSMAELVEGKFHILEPVSNQIAQAKTALVIMPLVAFDQEWNRIGYGKGYYDRYLQLHNNYRRIAIAYKIQGVSHIPAEVYDIKPELLITEG